jgi:hypothetical protein
LSSSPSSTRCENCEWRKKLIMPFLKTNKKCYLFVIWKKQKSHFLVNKWTVFCCKKNAESTDIPFITNKTKLIFWNQIASLIENRNGFQLLLRSCFFFCSELFLLVSGLVRSTSIQKTSQKTN